MGRSRAVAVTCSLARPSKHAPCSAGRQGEARRCLQEQVSRLGPSDGWGLIQPGQDATRWAEYGAALVFDPSECLFESGGSALAARLWVQVYDGQATGGGHLAQGGYFVDDVAKAYFGSVRFQSAGSHEHDGDGAIGCGAQNGERSAQGQVSAFEAALQDGQAPADIQVGFVLPLAGREQAAGQVFDSIEVDHGQVPVVLDCEPSGHHGNLKKLDDLLVRKGGWVEPPTGEILEVGRRWTGDADLFQVPAEASRCCEQEGWRGDVESRASCLRIRVEQPRPKSGPEGDRA